MVTYMHGNIFDSTAQVLVNPVNCVGVMGKGLALEFRKRYPEMYRDYREKCLAGSVRPGTPYIYIEDSRLIMNFPTKDNWKDRSDIRYIADGLDWFRTNYKMYGISSAAFPALGCGCGCLRWDIVKKEMEQKLGSLNADIQIYLPR